MSARLIKFCDSIAGELPFPTAVPSLPVKRENVSPLIADTDRGGREAFESLERYALRKFYRAISVNW